MPGPAVSGVDTEEVDHERAESFLRLLAETELRDPQPPQRHAGGATDFSFFSLSPLSPVPARLAGLCATLRIGGHGITATSSPLAVTSPKPPGWQAVSRRRVPGRNRSPPVLL
jgi:hypothetical protein